jgi:adenylate cyclase
MRDRRKRVRLSLLLGVGLVSAAFAVATWATDLMRETELDSLDMRFDIRGDEPQPEDIVVVAVDDVTFQDLGLRWPFRRTVHAEMVDALRKAGVKAVAYDVQFTEPSENPEDDNALILASRRAGNVVFATTEVNEKGQSAVFGGPNGLRFGRARDGDASLSADPDGVLRRFSYSLQGLQNFAAGAAEVLSGEDVTADDFPDEESLVAFRGGPGAIDQVSFSHVLEGKVDESRLRGRVAVVGATAPSLQDVHATATTGEELMSGPEFQANAISTVLDDFPLREVPGAVDVLLIVLLSIVPPLASLLLRPLIAIPLSVLAGAAYFGIAVLAFNGGTVLPVVFPLLGLTLATVGSLGVYYVTTAYERERTRDILGRIVNDSVADQLLAFDRTVALGGRDAECTVLFSDLRGFTAYSESQSPARVIEVLNRYHTEMEDALFEHGGTLVSYMGDGIMAVFGAPVDQEDHADRALACAREMLNVRMPRFNEWMRSQGAGDGFRMGIGLNSGQVLSGQIGSERRFEYTTIGDTVNTASRLEGMTKGTPHQVFIADTVREHLLRDAPDLIFVDEFEVRGRQAKVKIWSFDGDEPPPSAA